MRLPTPLRLLPLATLLPAADDAPAAARILAWTKMLSADEFEGRAPGTRGEDRTVGYLEQEFRKLGLKPGNPDGTYVQKVPLAGRVSVACAGTTDAGRRRRAHASARTLRRIVTSAAQPP